ncbi:MSMEG_0567/Sll0786 family nitrogen starvation N-acetyltransferase [Synechococcus sp. PCC 7336]|uniref:MSMEG_0567/Sll0786 family nitrogen starvation N-acetyltransferase n=1 Tax=Synechococcus sp. PCC 7336 TaxID=195250 RepID=UPI0003469234|nr:MSMEG_0567/Sll0786 family nitrogen starvation N-acetyltransferase [Synechococcus sp. PCC 7336]
MAQLSYTFELAQSPEHLRGYFNLRQSIFCDEQQLFSHSDIDRTDNIAYPIVALDRDWVAGDRVVGVVRIYEAEPRLWYGGRLGVHARFRRRGRIGQGLIQKAVTTANAWGCDRFLATVQWQNVRFFRRLHWTSLEEIALCGQRHHLMEADLNYYPLNPAPRMPQPLVLAEVS